MHARVKHILPMTLIRRERTLPAPGKVVARAGQKVSPLDTLAEANLYPEYVLLDVAQALGISAEKADRAMRCQAGDQIAQGDMIAGPVGWTRRLIRSPRDGRVALVGSGQALIEIAGKPFQLKAGMPGEVVELLADYGAILETSGALVQAVWGNGKIDYGPLRVQVRAPDEEARAAGMDVSLRGSVLMAGYCREEEVLRTAEELPLRGLILPSMESRLIPAASRLSIPVIVVEGFGKLPYNPMVYKLLSTNEQRPTAVNAEEWNPQTGAGPEIIIPVPAPSNIVPPPGVATLVVNSTVRIVSAPRMGGIGRVISIHNSAQLPNGIRTLAAEVLLEDGQAVLIPAVNLEVIA